MELFSPSGCLVHAFSQVNASAVGQVVGTPCSFSETDLMEPSQLNVISAVGITPFIVFFLLFGYRVYLMMLWFLRYGYPLKQLVLSTVFRIHVLILISSFVLPLALIPPWTPLSWFFANTIGSYIPLTSFSYIALFEIWMKPLNDLAGRDGKLTSLLHTVLQILNPAVFVVAFGLQAFAADGVSRFIGAILVALNLMIWGIANVIFAVKVLVILYMVSKSSRMKAPPLFRLSLLAFGISGVVFFVSSTGIVEAVDQLGEEYGARVLKRDALAMNALIRILTVLVPVWILMALVFVIQKKSLDALKLLFPSRTTHGPQSAAS